MKNIIYIGNSNPKTSSYQRAKALERLGNNVIIKDPYVIVEKKMKLALSNKFHYLSGYRFLQSILIDWIREINFTEIKPDIVWVNSGELLGSKCIAILKMNHCPVILYNNDDPTGGRDGGRFGSLLSAIKLYDLCVVMREVNINEFKALGAKNVLKVTMSCDEVANHPFDKAEDIPKKFHSDVAFIGTWMRHENRDEFLLDLINRGVPLSIWGDRWYKSPLWNAIKPFHRGSALSGKDYVAAIQGAKICLGLLSKGNRDLHTMRSFEIPYIGGLLCAERTVEHEKFYLEGHEAVFWNDSSECADVCLKLLKDDKLRNDIREAGFRRVRELGVLNEPICQKIIANCLA
ncbi:CgeB family protein [Fibrella aquatica]|uniref:CgeB family protein n=1 Tax=Fibrella aquatica TaxID=3242487 RepID=UPI00352238EA